MLSVRNIRVAGIQRGVSVVDRGQSADSSCPGWSNESTDLSGVTGIGLAAGVDFPRKSRRAICLGAQKRREQLSR